MLFTEPMYPLSGYVVAVVLGKLVVRGIRIRAQREFGACTSVKYSLHRLDECGQTASPVLGCYRVAGRPVSVNRGGEMLENSAIDKPCHGQTCSNFGLSNMCFFAFPTILFLMQKQNKNEKKMK